VACCTALVRFPNYTGVRLQLPQNRHSREEDSVSPSAFWGRRALVSVVGKKDVNQFRNEPTENGSNNQITNVLSEFLPR
jgi:hypothetical protein